MSDVRLLVDFLNAGRPDSDNAFPVSHPERDNHEQNSENNGPGCDQPDQR